MDKAIFFDQLVDTLRKEAMHAIKASQDAADYATDEEARAESKWDTQGLEASYLAAGQAGQAKQWSEAVEVLQSNREDLLKANTKISLGALFTCDFDGSGESFFLSSVAGGQVISMDNKVVTVITTNSPLAVRLSGLKTGDDFMLPTGRSGKILTIE